MTVTPALLYFELKLGVSLARFFFKVIRVSLGKSRYLLILVVLLLGMLSLGSLIKNSLVETPSEPDLILSVPSQETYFVEKPLTHQEAQVELDKWLKVLEKQPSHRDVLINISQLYKALGEENKAIYYWEQARNVDPNSPIFN